MQFEIQILKFTLKSSYTLQSDILLVECRISSKVSVFMLVPTRE